MAHLLRILILEDRSDDADLEEYELQKAGLDFKTKRVMTERDYIRELQSFSPQLILSDYCLPQYNVYNALAEARKHCPDTPFVLVTGAVEEEEAIDILTQGAKDYVFKNHLRRLAPVVKRAVAEADLYRAYKRTKNELLGSCRTDITKKRSMEHEFIRDEKLRSIGRLAGGIAHDFNNLLAVIQGNVQLSKLKITKQEEAFEYLKAAESAVWQAAELTKRLITFANGGAPFKRICDIGKVLMNTFESCITNESLKKVYILDENLWPVDIDESQMCQVFRNIAVNAVEAMPEGGIIKVKAKNILIGHDNVLPLSEGLYVGISVEDTGEGIAKNKLPYIFDPYFSTKQRGAEKGMGLGLSICYSIISKHNGYITASSKEGYGSTFDVYIPAVNNFSKTELKSCMKK